jgi:glycosyltransferase involved in cell wall biosynthesis|tara:strand:- start:5690 stop:6910 length:1221 start_codon:yes stop_codon:yes gene_type:complete
MNIIIVNFALSGFAGDVKQPLLIVKGLMALGHKVLYVLPDGDGWYHDKNKSKEYEETRKKLLDAKGKIIEIEGISVLPIHCVSEKLGFYCPDASKIANKILPDYDVVYCLHWYYHLGMTFFKIADKLGIPFIVAAMAAFEKPAHNLKSFRKNVIDLVYTKKLFKKGGGFHSVGDMETTTYTELGANPNKIFKVDHGIVPENFQLKNSTGILEKIGLEVENDEYIYNVGRIDPKKGLEILLESFAKIKKNHDKLFLVITGTGIKKYVDEIKQLAKKLEINDYVKFTGFISEEEKIELFKSAKIHVVTSHSDVHTTTAIESMACGTPVVISKASDFPEIDEYEAGITVDLDSNSVCNAVEKLLNDDEKLEEYSKNTGKLINDKFLLKNKFKEYEKMFEDTINNYKVKS